MDSRTLSGKTILCQVWNDKLDNVLARKKVKYGTPYFNVKIGGRTRRYKINYDTDGVIKQNGKLWVYDTDFSNTIGAMKFSSFSEHEVLDSDEAYQVFENNGVKMYVSKGGIPLLYLAICMIAVVAMAFAIIATVPSGLSASEQRDELDKQITALRQENAVLKSRLQDGDVGNTENPIVTIP